MYVVTGNAITITLPHASTAGQFLILAGHNRSFTVRRQGKDNIRSYNTSDINVNAISPTGLDSISLVSDGSGNWYVLNLIINNS